ncbi:MULTISPECIES: hypothetical protein [Pusillimonas]|uniref:hypothetical protein n=1 Tax=Pusillimonas TaxID=305976 RepID=UPI000E59D2AE|nr:MULTISPECIES: hypothetical protein [Pusillimonas]MDX3895690.1 hypothetical protein [Pusillimonas sp.]TFL11239.1 hypothetical protein CSC67_16950 [Pusillimonas caeni]
MNISLQTLETLHRLTSQDASLLDNLYAVRSLEQAVDVVADSARRLCVSIDRGEVVSYFESSLTGAGSHE